MRLILASASPRRLDLLARIGVVPDAVIPADIDEAPARAELPVDYARRIAREKAAAVQRVEPGSIILAADTVVAAGRRILPKTEHEEEARKTLLLLSGRRHRVHTAITMIAADGAERHRLSTTIVSFKRFSDAELDDYLAGGEWRGKAGAYAIQGRAEALIRQISGSHSGVVGLPLFETRALLIASGYAVG
jgi:septum formation protein